MTMFSSPVAAACRTVVTGVLVSLAAVATAAEAWNSFPGEAGPGKGKQVVLVSGDEEYRSEEALTQLGKILAKHHGFDCTVLYAIDAASGEIGAHPRSSGRR